MFRGITVLFFGMMMLFSLITIIERGGKMNWLELIGYSCFLGVGGAMYVYYRFKR